MELSSPHHLLCPEYGLVAPLVEAYLHHEFVVGHAGQLGIGSMEAIWVN